MALKDWHRLKSIENEYSITFKKENAGIIDVDKRLWITLYEFAPAKHSWRLRINIGFPVVLIKDFSTKSQALKFAKQYMKNH